MQCKKCKKEYEEAELQGHHLHPRFMDNSNGKGMKTWLCKKCHYIIHLKIGAMLWRYIPEKSKIECINNARRIANGF